MGAQQFMEFVQGDQPLDDAFEKARQNAAYLYGHGGYTGTVAEKDSVATISKKPVEYGDALAVAHDLLADNDPRCAEKWGPAGAIRIRGGGTDYATGREYNGWLIFGTASE